MEPEIKVMQIAERYRRIAKHIFDSKIADEIQRIAEDYERLGTTHEAGVH
ncbi:MAG TPA: hypothetical protein VJR47_12440 [Stellaceae bacterium]|nr:hypothetical protein [Stellaceae bacterium]